MYKVIKVKFPTGKCHPLEEKDFARYTNKFGESKEYSYNNDIEDLKVGDTVVVDTQYGLRLAKVVSLFSELDEVSKWVVQKVDVKGFLAGQEERERRRFIYKQMKTRLEQASFLERARAVAETDDEMKKLFEALEGKETTTEDGKSDD